MPIRTESGLKLTYEDYALIPDDGLRHEIIDGEHHVSPAPFTRHQLVSVRLCGMLLDRIVDTGQGEVFFPPTDVELSRFDIVQPDLLVVLERNLHVITPARIMGAPDLVVEVLSPSTSRMDRGKKKDRYARGGVPEYWIVGGDECVVQHFVLREQDYELVEDPPGAVTLLAVPGLKLELGKLWLAPRPT